MGPLEVDMLAEARNAQWSADAFLGPGALKLVAPAKVNLFLGVGERTQSGYHEVTNVMHALALHDVLHLHGRPAERGVDPGQLPSHKAVGGPENNLLVSIDMVDKTTSLATSATAAAKAGDIGGTGGAEGAAGTSDAGVATAADAGGTGACRLSVAARDNLAFAAVDELAREIGRTQREEIAIHIRKHIPHQAGLGGGSSDAAAVLLGCARLWGLADDDPAVHAAARRIGADVPFFLHGGCARLGGFGDRLERSLRPDKTPVVLVKPAAGVSTAAAYRAFDRDPAPVPAELLAQAHEAVAADQVPPFNNLTAAAEHLAPDLAEVHAWLRARLAEQGVRNPRVLLCGSGACTFGMAPDFASASRVAAAAQARGWWARATTLSGLRAAVVGSRQ